MSDSQSRQRIGRRTRISEINPHLCCARRQPVAASWILSRIVGARIARWNYDGIEYGGLPVVSWLFACNANTSGSNNIGANERSVELRDVGAGAVVTAHSHVPIPPCRNRRHDQ